MNTQRSSAAPEHRDRRLRGTTAVVGLLLLAASLFVATSDITHATNAVWLFRFSAALGLLTLLSAGLPSPEGTAVRERPIRPDSRSAI